MTLSNYKVEQKKESFVIEHKATNGKKKNDNKIEVYPNTNNVELITEKKRETIILPSTIVIMINNNCYLPEYIVEKFNQ